MFIQLIQMFQNVFICNKTYYILWIYFIFAAKKYKLKINMLINLARNVSISFYFSQWIFFKKHIKIAIYWNELLIIKWILLRNKILNRKWEKIIKAYSQN